MKRRLGLLAVAAMVATLGFFAPSSPASADTDVCVGNAAATLNNGLGYPILYPARNANFSITFTVPTGVCPVKFLNGASSMSATGSLTGNCGLSTGKGSTDNGHSFVFTSTGTLLILTGDLVGVVSAFPDVAAAGTSCAAGTGTRFIITGGAVKRHCTITVLTSKTTVAVLPGTGGNPDGGHVTTQINLCV